jgi:hypothetical protein
MNINMHESTDFFIPPLPSLECMVQLLIALWQPFLQHCNTAYEPAANTFLHVGKGKEGCDTCLQLVKYPAAASIDLTYKLSDLTSILTPVMHDGAMSTRMDWTPKGHMRTLPNQTYSKLMIVILMWTFDD